jgi:hypothetical protein
MAEQNTLKSNFLCMKLGYQTTKYPWIDRSALIDTEALGYFLPNFDRVAKFQTQVIQAQLLGQTLDFRTQATDGSLLRVRCQYYGLPGQK